MRIRWLVLAWLVGCASPPPPDPTPAPVAEPAPPAEEPAFVCPEERGLCFAVDPTFAELDVNGEVRGQIDEVGKDGRLFLPLEAGIYRVTLSAEGYITWRTEVSVQDGAEQIEVNLTREE